MTLTIIKGDITTISADAIVNAANAELIPGGGVDGAINRAAGPELGAVMRGIGGTPPGTAVHTRAFQLPAKYIIHAVGPIYARYTNEAAGHCLAKAYRSAYGLARRLECKTIAVPFLSTGAYGFPLDAASEIALAISYPYSSVLDITLVAFSDEICDLCEHHKSQYF